MARKKVAKKKSPEIDIKVRNIDTSTCCSTNYTHQSNFWIFGSIIAITLSYERSASILWAILHGIFSWFYILFRAMQIWGWF